MRVRKLTFVSPYCHITVNYDHIEQMVELNSIRGSWFVHANGLHKFYNKLSFIITGWNSIRSLYNVSIMQKSELDFSKSVFLLWRVIIKNPVCFYRRRNLVNLLSTFVCFLLLLLLFSISYFELERHRFSVNLLLKYWLNKLWQNSSWPQTYSTTHWNKQEDLGRLHKWRVEQATWSQNHVSSTWFSVVMAYIWVFERQLFLTILGDLGGRLWSVHKLFVSSSYQTSKLYHAQSRYNACGHVS